MTSAVTIVWDQAFVEHELETSDPTDVLRRIDALDGSDCTLVTVFRDAAHMTVGGSVRSGLVVYATFDDSAFHQLVSREPMNESGDSVDMVIAGGQAGAYPRRLVVDAVIAKSAIQVFLDEGTLDPRQSWETS